MKTAIQELLEYIEEYGSVVPLEQDRIYIKAEELLVKEREQIEEAYKEGLCGEVIPAWKYYEDSYGEKSIEN